MIYGIPIDLLVSIVIWTVGAVMLIPALMGIIVLILDIRDWRMEEEEKEMNVIRVTFEDGVIYDYVAMPDEIESNDKHLIMLHAVDAAYGWRRLVNMECGCKGSFITRVEWYSYNFNQNKED